MFLYSERLRKFIQKWPGKKTFGVYRFLPLFFICGALLEFSMINWQVGQVNFYKVYKKRIVLEMVEERLRKMEEKDF
uniref:small integral membrane protein 4 n=1 Tax=Vespula vulgaris TaxID=7454 RepID=UPI00223A91FC|nr:small integral membrane protein 4 [Vespula vulgaris]